MKERDTVLFCPALLVPFHLLCYANLKKYVFDHHFSFPLLPSKWSLVDLEPAKEETVRKVEEYISSATPEQRGFFVITSDGDVHSLATLTSNLKVVDICVLLMVRLRWGIYPTPPLRKQNPNRSKTSLRSSISTASSLILCASSHTVATLPLTSSCLPPQPPKTSFSAVTLQPTTSRSQVWQ